MSLRFNYNNILSTKTNLMKNRFIIYYLVYDILFDISVIQSTGELSIFLVLTYRIVFDVQY